MKKYIYFLLSVVCLTGFTACSDDDLVGSHNLENSVSIVSQNVLFDAAAGQGTIVYSAPGTATVTSSADWCHISVSGNTINVSVDENTGYDGRAAAVTITYGDDSRMVSVQQKGIVIIFTYVTEVLQIGSGGGSATFAGSSTDAVTISTDVDWITAVLNGDGTVAVSVAKNLTYNARTGVVTISAPAHDNVAFITIKQAERTLPLVDGTYTMFYYTNNTESESETIEVTLKKSETEEGVYNLTGIYEDWIIPMHIDTENQYFYINNTQYVGTYTNSGTTYSANVCVNYTNGSSNYYSCTQDERYAIYLDYTIDDNDKYHLTLRNSAPLFNPSRESTGMSIYAFSSFDDISSSTRVGGLITMRKPKLDQK